MKKLLFLISTFVFITIFIAGCGSSSLAVKDRPHPPLYSQPLAPGPNYIWVSGEWIPRHRRYVYRKGYWVHMRPGHVIYVEGHWHSRRRGWVGIPGYWRRF